LANFKDAKFIGVAHSLVEPTQFRVKGIDSSSRYGEGACVSSDIGPRKQALAEQRDCALVPQFGERPARARREAVGKETKGAPFERRLELRHSTNSSLLNGAFEELSEVRCLSISDRGLDLVRGTIKTTLREENLGKKSHATFRVLRQGLQLRLGFHKVTLAVLLKKLDAEEANLRVAVSESRS
jgi:hypothetical protein